MAEQEQYGFGRQEQTESQSQSKKVCKYCGAPLEDGFAFCVECGQKIGGEEHVCPVCKTTCTSEYCPHCGYKVIPTVCPKCGAESNYDFCEQCGEILNDGLRWQLEGEHKPAVQMSEQEIREAEQLFNKEKSDEVKNFLKKVEEYRILQQESDYFKKRETRIIKVFGKNPIEYSVPDMDERAAIMAAYESLGKIVTEREERAKKEILEKLYPKIEAEHKAEDERIAAEEAAAREAEKRAEEEAKREAEAKKQEIMAKKAEMDKKFKELMSGVSSELKKAQLEEQKRLEEERLRKEEEERQRRAREAELERQRREREREREAILRAQRREIEYEQATQRALQTAEENRILGTYVSCGYSETIEICITSRSGGSVSGTVKTDSVNGYGYGRLSGRISGDELCMSEYSYSTNISGYLTSFSGIFCDSGHSIIGTWGHGSSEYCKI